MRPSLESVSNPAEAEAVVSATPKPCHPGTEAGATGLALAKGSKWNRRVSLGVRGPREWGWVPDSSPPPPLLGSLSPHEAEPSWTVNTPDADFIGNDMVPSNLTNTLGSVTGTSAPWFCPQ